jgi:hypothetical protein
MGGVAMAPACKDSGWINGTSPGKHTQFDGNNTTRMKG